MKIRRPQCALGVPVLLLALYSSVPSRGEPPDRAARPYEAEVEAQQGADLQRVRLLVDGARFRAQDYVPGTRTLRRYVYLYDGSQPAIVWGCNLNARSARPEPESCARALSALARRDGKPSVRKQFGIPNRAPDWLIFADNPPQPPLGGLTELQIAKLPNPSRTPSRLLGMAVHLIRGEATERNGATRQTTAWVEPNTGLLLRLDQRTTFGAGSPAPPLSMHYRVTRITFLRSVPIDRFQLPPGTTAHLPETLSAARLPAGVRVVGERGVGIVFR